MGDWLAFPGLIPAGVAATLLVADRATSPLRTAFIERHRSPVLMLTAAAAISSGVLGLRASREVLLICGGVLAVGLLYRRLKHQIAWKGLYVTAAWVAAT